MLPQRNVRARLSSTTVVASSSEEEGVGRVNTSGILRALQDEEELTHRISHVAIVDPDDLAPLTIPNPAFRRMAAIEGACKRLTNFNAEYLMGMAAEMESFMPVVNRGRKRSISCLDSLVLLLHQLKLDLPCHQVAGYHGLGLNAVRGCTSVALIALHTMLQESHKRSTKRPMPLEGLVPDVALLIDTVFFRVPKLARGFSDARILWNAHKHCYCVKMEVAVEAGGRHKAVFWSPMEVGSMSDRTIFKKMRQDTFLICAKLLRS